MEVQPNQPSENVMADGKGNVPGISATLQESKEHLSALKSQVAFAHQCLSLLQNQLNHAADTLGILQDQLVKAQDTLDHVVVPCGIHQPGITKRCHIHQHQHHCGAKSMEPLIGGVAEVPKSKGPQQSNENIPEGRAGHVPCGRDTQPSAGPSHHSLCDYPSAVRQLAVTPLKHGPGTVRSTGSTCKLSPELHRVPQPTPVSSSGSDPVKPMGPPPGELSVKVEPTTERDSSTEGVTEQCTSFAPSKPAKLQSSSPMAHQLLQVIDVLQSADEEKGGVQGDAATIQPTPPMGGAPVASHYESLADPLLRTMPPGASMHSRQRASPRKGRKPGWPLKLPAASGNAALTAAAAADFDSPDLMRVPQPVLACTLPSEFLVVPATNYDQDGPSPKAVSAARNHKESGSSSNDGAVAIMPFMTSTAGVVTAGSSTQSFDQKSGEAAVVTCLAQTARKASADSSYSAHNIVQVNRCTDSLPVQPSSVVTSNCAASLSIISPRNGVQFISTSERPAITETMTTLPERDPRMKKHAEAEPALAQLNASEKHVPEGSQKAARAGAKKPIILSRRPSREQNLPEGVVVLVPTLEHAKRLIATSGTTPVLIPQEMLNDVRPDKGDSLHDDRAVTVPAKRCIGSSPGNEAPAKRPAHMVEPL